MPPPLAITSLQNPRVKEAVKLRDRRQRDKQRRTLVDGAREIRLALSAGIQPIELFVCPELCHTVEGRLFLQQLPEIDSSVYHVTPEVFEKLTFGERAEGVLAVIETPLPTLEDWRLPEPPLLAVLEGIEKPGNIGAVLRSADGAGVHGVIVTGQGTDLYNPNTIRASLGTIFARQVATVAEAETLAWLRSRGVRMIAAQVDAIDLYTDVDYRGPTAIILGSEAHGLSKFWRAADVAPVRVPMLGMSDSLNVSATAAVLFYEALRQRHAA